MAAQPEPELDLVFLWHMHQPDYRAPEDGEFALPWVYLHALKDYSDMAAHLERHPRIRAVVNFVPVLLDQIEDYVLQLSSGRLRDPLLRLLARTETEPLSAAERALLGARCLQPSNFALAQHYPRYRRLYELFQALEMQGAAALAYLSDRFYYDALTWFHLAWTGETVRRESEVVTRLMAVGEAYTAQQRAELLRLIGELVRGVVGRYAHLAAEGRIELSTTPQTHPLAPLLLDFRCAREAEPNAPLPAEAEYPGGRSRVAAHLHAALGAGPTDMWVGHGFEASLPGFSQATETRNRHQPGNEGKALDGAFWEKLAAARGASGETWASEEPSASPAPQVTDSPPAFRYLGRAFGPFLVFEKDSELFILDQHAAHERILYDELSGSSSASQALLVPFLFESEDEGVKRRLTEALPDLGRIGYAIERSGDAFVVNAIPAFLGEKAIPALVDCFGEDAVGGRAGDDFIATMSCRAAIKDGDLLDDFAARALIARALALPFPRCPHGRPIWARFDRTALYRMVGRITA